MVVDVLVDLRKPALHVVDAQAVEVDHHHAPRALGEVAAVAVGQDVVVQAVPLAQAERSRLLGRDDEAAAVELYAGA